MSKVKGTHKFQVVKTLLEVIYGLTWVFALFAIVFYFKDNQTKEAALVCAAILGGTVVFTTVLILTISTIDSRNLLSDIYALNLADDEE